MADVIIKTDGTLANTVLTVDGKEVTKDCCIVGINMYACAPYKSEMMGDVYKGDVSVSYSMVNDSGTLERHSFGGCGDHFASGIGEPTDTGDDMGMGDSLKIKTVDQVVRFIGRTIPVEKEKIIEKIIKHCADNNITCASKDELSIRSDDSLKDKLTDLNIKLED